VIAAERVHAAHADAWELEGRAQARCGCGSGRVRGVRLMASGLPDARWNNADITAADVDLDAVVGWYRSRAVPWGIRVPLSLPIAFGTASFVKRCFALLPDELTDSEVEVEARMIRVQPAGLERFVAAEAVAFDTPAQLAARWIGPVFGRSGFAHRLLSGIGDRSRSRRRWHRQAMPGRLRCSPVSVRSRAWITPSPPPWPELRWRLRSTTSQRPSSGPRR
jgi:hypothetical protein